MLIPPVNHGDITEEMLSLKKKSHADEIPTKIIKEKNICHSPYNIV